MIPDSPQPNFSPDAVNQTVNARSLLLRSNRFDVPIKFAFAEALTRGEPPEWLTQAYLDNIRAFNGFFEAIPEKNSPEDFLRSFRQTFESLRRFGFDAKESRISVNWDGQVVDGAHRLACAAALDLDVIVERSAERPDYGQFFFEGRGQPVSVSDLTARVVLSYNRSTRLFFVWGCVSPTVDAEIHESLNSLGHVNYRRSEMLPLREVVSLKRILYSGREHQSWTGDGRDGFSGIRRHARSSFGRFPTRTYLVSDAGDSALRDFKVAIRDRIGLGNYPVHTTDTWEETKKVGEFLYGTDHRMILRHLNLGWDFEADRFAMANHNHARFEFSSLPPRFLITGSSTLDILGIRNRRDVDYLSDQDLSPGAVPEGDNHGEERHHYSAPIEELLSDPQYSFQLGGVRYLSPRELLRFKARRREWPKDFVDAAALITVMVRAIPDWILPFITSFYDLRRLEQRVRSSLKKSIDRVYLTTKRILKDS